MFLRSGGRAARIAVRDLLLPLHRQERGPDLACQARESPIEAVRLETAVVHGVLEARTAAELHPEQIRQEEDLLTGLAPLHARGRLLQGA